MLRELFGEAFVHLDEDFPSFWLTMGSAVIRIFVWPYGDDESTIQVYSAVVREIETTPDLMKYLLNANADMRFVAFGIDSDGDVVFQHTIMGDTCDKPELKASVLAVVYTADGKDDEIIAKFGGLRSSDVKAS